MPMTTRCAVFFITGLLLSLPAAAQGIDVPAANAPPAADSFATATGNSAASLSLSSHATPAFAQDAGAPPPRAFEYSDGYKTRAKIHKVASFATIPLFVTEGFLGQSLYDDPSSGKKDAHLAVAAGIGTLFAVNTVTGVWNLVEARHDPNHSGRRWTHGLLMLGADAGFLATAALGPSGEHGDESSRGAHRAMAFTSIGLASTGYLIMLFGGH
jgi:hypothetical protein